MISRSTGFGEGQPRRQGELPSPARGDPSTYVSASPAPLAAHYVRLKYAKLLLLQHGLPLESAKR